jgi:hypothetical protein
MMGDTYSRITEDAKGEWQMQRAQIIFSIEQNMSDEELEGDGYKYWVEKDGKRFLQIEEEHPDAFNEFTTLESLQEKARITKEKAAAVEAEAATKLAKHKAVEQAEALVVKMGMAWKSRRNTVGGVVNTVMNAEADEAGGEGRAEGESGEGMSQMKEADDGRGGGGASVGQLEAKFAELASTQTRLLMAEMSKLRSAITKGGAGAGAGATNANSAPALPTTLNNGGGRDGWRANGGDGGGGGWAGGGGEPMDGSVALLQHQQAKLESKVEIFSATAASLMAKNCELESQVATLRSRLEARHSQSLSSSFTTLLPGGGY